MAQEICLHCGASLKKYWHKLTPGLVATLIKIYVAVSYKGENRVKKNELDLSHSEYGNFQKLRFHALIAKVKENGQVHHGEWLVTRRGADFLKGRVAVPYRVQTFRNHVVAHELKKVMIGDVANMDEYFEGYEDFKNQLEFMELPEVAIESTGVRTLVKRGKKLFCSCGGQVKKQLKPVGQSESGNMIIETKLICQLCQFEHEESNL